MTAEDLFLETATELIRPPRSVTCPMTPPSRPTMPRSHRMALEAAMEDQDMGGVFTLAPNGRVTLAPIEPRCLAIDCTPEEFAQRRAALEQMFSLDRIETARNCVIPEALATQADLEE